MCSESRNSSVHENPSRERTWGWREREFVCTRARACVRACMRAYVRACMRTCVRTCVRACVRAGTYKWSVRQERANRNLVYHRASGRKEGRGTPALIQHVVLPVLQRLIRQLYRLHALRRLSGSRVDLASSAGAYPRCAAFPLSRSANANRHCIRRCAPWCLEELGPAQVFVSAEMRGSGDREDARHQTARARRRGALFGWCCNAASGSSCRPLSVHWRVLQG